MPAKTGIVGAGRHDLARAIERWGGIYDLADALGYEVQTACMHVLHLCGCQAPAGSACSGACSTTCPDVAAMSRSTCDCITTSTWSCRTECPCFMGNSLAMALVPICCTMHASTTLLVQRQGHVTLPARVQQ